MSRIELPENLLKALQHMAGSSGVNHKHAERDFFDAMRSLPLSKLAEYERAIRDAAYNLSRSSKYTEIENNNSTFLGSNWLALFSWNGFVREAALRSIRSEAPNPFLLTVLIRRLNDWVPEVRAQARTTIPRVLVHTDANIIALAAWRILPVQSSWRRMKQLDELVLNSIFENPEVSKQLVEMLCTARAGPAASILKQVCRTNVFDHSLNELAEHAIQPSVRAVSYRIMLTGKATWPVGWQWKWIDKSLGIRVPETQYASRITEIEINAAELLNAALADASPFVRRVAGDYIVKNRLRLGASAEPLAQELAADPYPSIAQRGKFVLDNLPA